MTERSAAYDAIVTMSLTKKYKQVIALSDLSLRVDAGAIFGFLGPNGAGKTTTLKLLLGFISPTSGSAEIFGHQTWRDGVEARKHVGYLVPADAFYPEMSGRSQLDLAARFSGRPPILRRQLLDLLELAGRDLDRDLRQYSKGMKQKLALVAAAQHDPRLLVLDEPTDGLDPLVQRRFEQFLREFNGRGRTVFMSSHDLAEVERLCEAVAIVKEGRMVAQQSIEQIRRLRFRKVEVTFGGEAPAELGLIEHVELQSMNGRSCVLTVEGDINPLIDALARWEVTDLTITPPSLDDVFMAFYESAAAQTHPSRERAVASGIEGS
ncbi:ABC transporter ATP-binding protein [soil metagenome]